MRNALDNAVDAALVGHVLPKFGDNIALEFGVGVDAVVEL